MKKIIPVIIISIIAIGGGAFFGGMKYQQSKSSFPSSDFSRQNFQNLSQEQRQQLQANVGGNFQRQGSGFLSGEVMSKEAQSLTIKMQDGSSKIVFFSSSTAVTKTIDGSINDIEIGKQITVTGKQNSDGSYTAQIIQERQLPLPTGN